MQDVERAETNAATSAEEDPRAQPEDADEQAELEEGLAEEIYSAGQIAEPEDDYSQQEIVIAEAVQAPPTTADASTTLKAVIEAAIYITDEPLTLEQIAGAVGQPLESVKEVLAQLTVEYAAPDRGLVIRELAGGFKMSTKPEYHEPIRAFVKKLQPLLKLSLAALETLAVVAYKQPITGPEIMEIRGVQGAGVLKTLLDRRLIAAAGRKNVLGKPMMYKTTREFLIHFGLSSLAELPTLKEFEELGRLALIDSDEHAAPSDGPNLEPASQPASDHHQQSPHSVAFGADEEADGETQDQNG